MSMRQQYEAERRNDHRSYASDHSYEEWREEQRRIEQDYSPYFTWDWRPYLMDYNPWQRKAEVK